MSGRLPESVLPDAEDVRIIRALQVAPRASFSSTAAVLGTTEGAVARRYRRLERDGVVRVIGVVNTGALGQSQWMVRLRCLPGSVSGIATALAQREDVRWIAVSGAEVTCAVLARSHDRREELLADRLPRTAAVLDIRASMMLHQFLGGRGHYWAALRGALTDDQEAALGLDGPPYTEAPIAAAEPVRLDRADEQLLAALADDGRARLVDLAAATGLSPGRVSRRLHALVERRVVDIDVEIAPAALGYHARANLWLRVHPGLVTTVGRVLAGMPEIAFAVAVTGTDNVHAVAHCRDLDELFRLTTDRLGSLPGVTALEVSPILRQVKQAGTRVAEEHLVRPAHAAPRRS